VIGQNHQGALVTIVDRVSHLKGGLRTIHLDQKSRQQTCRSRHGGDYHFAQALSGQGVNDYRRQRQGVCRT